MCMKAWISFEILQQRNKKKLNQKFKHKILPNVSNFKLLYLRPPQFHIHVIILIFFSVSAAIVQKKQILFHLDKIEAHTEKRLKNTHVLAAVEGNEKFLWILKKWLWKHVAASVLIVQFN